MIKEVLLTPVKGSAVELTKYEVKFKAMADQIRLQIMHKLARRGTVCVCDLTDMMDMSQSKLSYHLKILLEAQLILKETRGTWSYYQLNHDEIERLLAPDLASAFRVKDVPTPRYC